jgi:cell division septation protein DedD
MADEGFHEIQLSGKHLVALFMAATVVAVVIFLCGVIVGRDIYKQRVAMAQAASDAPVDPTAEARPPRTAEPTGSSGGAGSGSAAPGGASQEKLSYPDRLASNAPAPESLKPAPSVPAPERVPVPPPERADPVPTRNAPGEPAGGGFAVQVAAVGERAEADTIARRLTNKGYPAYVMPPAAGAPRVFRVRVGKFKDRREAEQIAGRLQREEQFKPWITR